ncbi:MAG: hypothetical protein ABGY96_24275 [bacterium]
MTSSARNEIEPRQDHYQTLTHTAKTTTSSSSVAIAANVNRRYLLIQNDDTVHPAYINIGGTAAANTGIKLVAGGSFEISRHVGNLSTLVVNCIQGNSGEVLLITEGVNRVS